MRIGIYGGSFNPPHNGHQEIARKFIVLNYVDKVICVQASGQYVVLDRYIRTGICEDFEAKRKIDLKHSQNLFKLQPIPSCTFDPKV